MSHPISSPRAFGSGELKMWFYMFIVTCCEKLLLFLGGSKRFLFLFDLILYVPSTIFQL